MSEMADFSFQMYPSDLRIHVCPCEICREHRSGLSLARQPITDADGLKEMNANQKEWLEIYEDEIATLRDTVAAYERVFELMGRKLAE